MFSLIIANLQRFCRLLKLSHILNVFVPSHSSINQGSTSSTRNNDDAMLNLCNNRTVASLLRSLKQLQS
ncbi:unnamed protein product [Tenebrio molitor]|nr:unnamed protein product [Tenebrio molitor]